jgi:hypothetical protein
MSRVFIVNDGGHDYSDAARYGETVILSEGLINKFSLTKMLRQFTAAMSGSKPSDYILISGPSVMNIIACSLFVSKHGKLNLLLWRTEANGNDRYIARRLMFS